MLVKIILNLILFTCVGFLLAFIAINLMTGCQDWSQPNCVTPWQLLGLDK